MKKTWANEELKSRFYTLRHFIISFGDDFKENKLKNYFEFKNGFTRDITNIEHFDTGNLKITFTDMA